MYILGLPARSRTLVCDFVLPGDVQDASDAVHVEGIEFSFLSSANGPEIAATQECAQDAGTEDLDLGMFGQLGVSPHFIC